MSVVFMFLCKDGEWTFWNTNTVVVIHLVRLIIAVHVLKHLRVVCVNFEFLYIISYYTPNNTSNATLLYLIISYFY